MTLQLCYTVPSPINILLQRQPPAPTASFFQKVPFIIIIVVIVVVVVDVFVVFVVGVVGVVIIIIIAVVIIKARAHSKVLPKSSNHDRWG